MNSAKTLPASDSSPESSRPTLVVPQQPAERLMTDDVVQAQSLQRLRRRRLARNGHVAETLVRPELVIIDQPLLYDVPQMAFAEDEKVVEDLMLGPLHPDFGERVQVWRPCRNGAKLDTIGLQDGAELGSELAVAVTDDVRGLKLGRLLGEDHAHVACDLGHPRTIGIGSHAGQVDATGVQVNEEQHIEGDRPAERPHRLGEEVGRPDGLNCRWMKSYQEPRSRFGPGSKPFS